MGLGSGTTGHFVGAGLAIVSPASRACYSTFAELRELNVFFQGGSITINSSNPFDPPLIDLGMLEDDFDLFALREAIKRAQQFFSAPVWTDLIIGPTRDLENITSAALDEFLRNTATPTLHLVGSAGMSARDAQYGVVDPDLLVKGLDGLRIIDASVIVRRKA